MTPIRTVLRLSAIPAVMCCALTGLTGCISLLPETEPDTLYRLEPVSVSNVSDVHGAQAIVIDQIRAPRALSGNQVAVEREGRVAYMGGAAWMSPVPALVQNHVMDMFHSEIPQLTPARSEDGVNARYRLQMDLSHYEAIYDQGGEDSAPQVRVRMTARLIDRNERDIVGARQVETRQRAGVNRQGAIIEAFSEATTDAARELARWTQTTLCSKDDDIDC